MRKFGLIGKSLDHSWSKDYFEQKFTREDIANCIYKNFSLVDLNGFRGLILHDGSIAGLNVTVPYKIEVLKYLDNLDPIAEAIGAVNCVKISRNWDQIHLKGYNTDMMAFRDTLKPLLNETCRKALVLGSGGASRAVCYALKELGMDYSIVSRTKTSGFLDYTGLNINIITGHQVIINTTPVGMFPDEGQCPPLPYQYLTNGHLLYDLIYYPEETLFLKKGIEARAMVKSGLEMLQLQAEMSWVIWNR